jgi:hypothetical protein
MSTPTVAQQLIDVLQQAGVERVYGIVGGNLNPIVAVTAREWVNKRSRRCSWQAPRDCSRRETQLGAGVEDERVLEGQSSRV